MDAAASVASRLEAVRAQLPADGRVTLVAVSKFHPAGAVAGAYAAGQRHFGESRAAELTAKSAALPADITWHFIGHLQTNKVRPVVAAASVIQSVDSERLLAAIDAEARRQGKRVKVLMQVHVAREETKFGFLPDELLQLMEGGAAERYTAVDFGGVMGMATNTDDSARIAADFSALRGVFDTLRSGAMASAPGFDTLSMGMSGDYATAIAHGSTMVRIGTDIFGPREY